MTRARLNLAGQVFGGLRAIESTSQRNHNRTVMWKCECLICGLTTLVASTKLKAGEISSCGCQEHVRSPRTEAGHSGFNSLYHNYTNGAKRRNLEFSLNKVEFKELTKGKCTYCGIGPSASSYGSRGKATEHGRYLYNGIDRVNSDIGYTISNCVPACAECNIAKGARTYDDFIGWIKRVYAFTNS